MASKAAGVAVGSSVGHTISHALFGGEGSTEPAPRSDQPLQQHPAAWQGYSAQDSTNKAGVSCVAQSKDLLRCFEAANNDASACSYYLGQLKASSAAAQSFA